MQMQVSHQSTPEDIKRYLTHLEEGGRSIPPQPVCCPCLELLAEHACGSEQRTAGWAAQPNVTSAPEGAYESTLGGTKNMRKRILASLMALILALSLLPTAALATGETQEPEQEAQMSVSENGTEGGGEDATIPVETGDETDTSDGTETPVVTTPTVTPTETTPVETLTPEPTNVTDGEAEVNGTQYATLAAAVSAAQSGDTIVMQKDTTLTDYINITQSLTLDLNGKTITSDKSKRLAFLVGTSGVTFTIDDTAGGGKIVSERADNSNVIEVSDGELVVKGGELVNEWFVVFVRRNGVATIEGGTLRSTVASALSTNGSREGEENYSGNAVMNVKSGNLISKKDVAIYVPAGTLNISGGTITGATAVYSKCGTTTITGGTIQGTGDKAEFQHSNNGCVATGDALVIEACAYPNGNPTVRISGGRFTSTNVSAVGYYEYDGNKAEEISITGGTFSTKPSEAYIASGYEATQTTAGWEVAAKDGMEANVNVPNEGEMESSATVGGSFTPNQGATGEAGEGTVDTGNGSVTINVQTGSTGGEDNKQPAPNDDVSSTTVTVDKASVSSVANAKVDVTLQTDVADLEIPSEAWNSMANAANNGDITIAVKENKTEETVTSWTVTAKAGGKDVFTAADATTITVMVTYDFEAENVVVYCTDSGKQEQMKTTWDKNTKTLSWETPHFSTFAPVTYSNGTEASWIGADGQPTTGTLADALTAVASSGGTITLLNDATVNNAKYTISKDVTIQTSAPSVDKGPTITDKVAEGASTVGITIQNGGSLTLDGAAMVVNGTEGTSGLESDKYNGTGLDVNYGGELTLENGASLALNGLNRGMVSSRPDSTNMTLAKITVDGSTLSADGIDGNFSNGGEFTFTNSIVNIKNCGNHGLSVEELTVTNSEVTLSGIGYSAIHGNELNFENGAVVNVSAAGSKLPKENWNGSETYTAPIQVKETAAAAGNLGHSMTVAQGASVSVTSSTTTDGKTNTIDLPSNANFINSGTVNATINVAAPADDSGNCVVQYVIGGETVYARPMSVNPTTSVGTVDRWVEGLPTKPGYTLSAWTCTDSSVTATTVNGYAKWSGVQSGETYVFNAYWIANPTPVVPDDNTPSYSGGSSSSETSYSNTIDASDGGSVKVSPRTPSRGETVTITPTPDAGYEVDEVIVTDRNGDAVEVTANRNGTYTFKQPRGRVTIEVTFVRTGGTAGAAPFLDVAEDAWYADAVAYVYDNGLMSGTSTTLFSPNATTTRGMIVTMLYRLEGEPRISSGSAFDDVDAGMYYADAVAWASQNDIVTGYDEATFGPNNAITREQMAAILYRYAQYKGYRTTAGADLSGYVDADSVSSYALASLQWANAAGLVTGTSSNTLTPDGSATRAQVATIFMRFMEDVAE